MTHNIHMVDVLDANGEVIGQASKTEVQQRKLFHRVAGLIVCNSKGEILVHRRSMATDHGGTYALFVCDVVLAGDTYLPTVTRMLRSMLRIPTEVVVQPLFPYNFHSTDAHIAFGMFRCTYDGPLDPDPTHIGEHFFSPIEEVEKLMAEKPFLPSSVAIFKLYQEGLKR